MIKMPVSLTWGTEPDERLIAFPCDNYVKDFEAAYYRGITIQADPDIIFRWLCQMRVAPYSYDWIDHFGRRSPQRLTPGLDELAVGQQVMEIFELVEFEQGRHFTFRMKPNSDGLRIFGDSAVTYLITPQTSNRCRLLVKLIVRYPSGAWGWLMRSFLPWGDLIMMRRQLLNFKALSEAVVKAT
jgi:hypothetical protein